MKVKLTFESDLSWTTEKVINVQSNVSDEDIKVMFSIAIGIPYNEEYCSYEIIQEGD